MTRYFTIFIVLILADSFGFITLNESIHSEYVSAKLLQSEINTEFIMRRIEYIPNQKINNVVYIKDVEPYIISKSNKIRKALFLCSCGNKFITTITKVKMGHTKSCGCYQSKLLKERITKHGLCKHPLHTVWRGMKTRCYNENDKYYNCYGGRGITVCKEWINDFKCFYDWAITNGYKKGLTIDRKENDGGYIPNNCRFVTNAENSRNSRQTKLNWDIVGEIRKIKLVAPHIKNTEVALVYNVTPTTIGRILKNKVWKI